MSVSPEQNTGLHAGRFQVTSTSQNSAVVSPVILRQSDSVRLVFKPMLVENNQESDATVNGIFCYQRKKRADTWEDVEAIPLSSLHVGEGVKLGLGSSEILKLFKGLQVLYDTVARDGVPTGTHTYLQADRGSVLGDVAELLKNGQASGVLSTFLEWARNSQTTLAETLGEVDAQTLLSFDSAVGVARLQKFINAASDNLHNGAEAYWQDLLERQSWVLSQIYASPMVIVRGQAYVGGKSIANQGGTVVDYMFRNSLSDNSLIVELKTPTTPLLTTNTYRNAIFGPSADLGGATQQLLHARQTLQEDYLTLTKQDPGKFNIFGTRSLLIIGTLPNDPERLRSFEIYRNAHRGLDIVTFDELLEKGRLLLQALKVNDSNGG